MTIELPHDALGDLIQVGDRVAFALNAAETVVGTVVELPIKDAKGNFYKWGGHSSNPRISPAIKVRVEVRANQWHTVEYEPDKQKAIIYTGPRRMVRLEKMDIAGFIAGLRESEEGLR